MLGELHRSFLGKHHRGDRGQLRDQYLTITVPPLPAGPYYVCAYNGILGSTPLLSGTTTAAYTTAAATTMTVTPNARTNIGVADTGTAFGVGTTVEFNSATCPLTYPAPSGTSVVAGTIATFIPGATSLTVTPPPGMTAGGYYVCAYTGSAGSSALVSKTAAADYTAYGVLTLSSNNGPSGILNSITATTSTGIFLTGTVVIVKPIAAACPVTYGLSGSAVAALSVRVLLPTKLAFTIPTTVVSGSPGPSYNICAYTGTSGSLISETVVPYVVAAQATITSVSPAGGPAQGGTSITVTGTNLGSVVSATVGGVALAIDPASKGASSFTAITPAHAAGGPFTVAVVTLSGPASKVGAFTYSNGIVVTPNKASNNGSIDIDVQGIGFGAMTFPMSDGSTPNDDSGHVYLVHGRYNPTSLVAVGSYKANDALLECTDVLVISDTELVCTLALAGNGVRPAWRVAVAVTDVTVAKGSSTLVSAASANFTSRDIGLTVGAAGIPDGTTIVSVLSATDVVLSAKATAAIATSA